MCPDESMSDPLRIIARVRSDFTTKFGIPRQSGLVDALEATVIFEPPFRNRETLRGLDGFSHIWLIWLFDRAVRRGTDVSRMDSGVPHMDSDTPRTGPDKTWSPTVRPPRLGGNTRVGVFATRSPFRPNPIAMSCVRLDRVEDSPDGPVLKIRGADLLDNTPVVDIKPYLPYADCHPEASAGFAPDSSGPLNVVIPPELLQRVPSSHRDALYGILAQDPRPHYHTDPTRIYGFVFAGMEIRFSVENRCLTVREIRNPAG